MRTIYYNGQVYTGNSEIVSAFAVEDGKFLFAGENQAALALAQEGDQTIDLQGKFVCAGFNDSHMHITSYGQALRRARLDEHTDSLEALIACLCRFAEENPPAPGGWIIGRGWNHDYFTDVSRMPNRYDLDRVSTEHPVAAVRCCGHSMAINSRAIELLGLTADTPQPDGGSIGIENGEPDGRLYDNAMDAVYSVIPLPDKAEIKAMLLAACQKLNACGITSCQSDDYSLPWRTVNEALREMEAEGTLTVRVYEQSNFQTLAALREFVEAGNVTGAGTDMFRIGPLKLLGDGSLGARTAYLSRPYSDDATTVGLPVFSQETLDEMIGYANEQGMQVAVHAIGDGCLDRVLSAIEKSLAAHPRDDHRHGIVHCQITRPDQLKKIADLNLHVYAQTIFIDYDSRIVRERVGDMADSSYSWKTLMEAGVSVSNGTDCPVESPESLRGIQCAVTRAPLDGSIPPYLPHEAFSVQEALDSYTVRSAEGSFEEHVKGKIQPDMLADFVVLDENPFSVAPDHIASIPVTATYLGGRQVYRA